MSKFSVDNQPAKRGRPVGAKSKRLSSFRANGNKLLDSLMERSNNGDDEAAKMVLPFMPKPKAEREKVNFEIKGDSLITKAECIVDSIATGVISADVGCQLISSISAMARIIELTEIIERLDMLEHTTVNVQNTLADRLTGGSRR